MFRPVADGYSAPGYCESKFQGFNLSGNLNHYVQTIHLARNPSRCFLIPDVNHDGFIADCEIAVVFFARQDIISWMGRSMLPPACCREVVELLPGVPGRS